jgi:hypothetical protein
LTVQHKQGNDFVDAWGIRFTDERAELVIFDAGGPPALASLYTYGNEYEIGQWVRFTLRADWMNDQAMVTVNGGSPTILPIDLTGDQRVFRFSYDGKNGTAVILLDDLKLNITQRNGAEQWESYR